MLYLVMGVCMIASSALYGQAERKYIRQGNKEYEQDVYDESEILYRKALEKEKDFYTGEFNLGDALYKQNKYQDAARSFNSLAENESDKGKLGQLYHNLGNSLLKSNNLEQSIEAYKQALRNNPADEETRHNLAFAQQLLQQQQQEQQQQNENQQDQENQDQQEQEQDDQQDQQEQPQDQDQQEQQQQISREDAERMLQALQQDEQELQEKLKKQKARAQSVKVLKDW